MATKKTAPIPAEIIETEIEETETDTEETEETEAKPKAKKAKPKKGELAKSSTVVEDNVIPIDGCPNEELRREAIATVAKIEDDHYAVSDLLAKIYTEGSFVEWGYGSWQGYVEKELDFALRKATYCVAISKTLSSLEPEFQREFRKMKWTALRELSGVLNNENAAEWLERTRGKSVLQIQTMRRGIESSAKKTEAEGDKLITMSFKVTPEQKENIERALARASTVSNSTAKGNLLDLICTDHSARSAGEDSLPQLLESIERASGIKIIALNADREIVFGHDLAVSLDEDAEEADAEVDEDEGDEPSF